MPTTLERVKIWLEILEPIMEGQADSLSREELDRLNFDLMAIEKDLEGVPVINC